MTAQAHAKVLIWDSIVSRRKTPDAKLVVSWRRTLKEYVTVLPAALSNSVIVVFRSAATAFAT